MERLPTEVQDLICSHCDRLTLSSLSQVSRSFYLSSRRRLYSHLDLNSSTSTKLLIRSFLSNPDLVKSSVSLILERGEKKVIRSPSPSPEVGEANGNGGRSGGGGNKKKKSKQAPVARAGEKDDRVKEDDLVTLVRVSRFSDLDARFTNLQSIALLGPFDLQRRHLTFTLFVSTLTSLSLCGLPSAIQPQPTTKRRVGGEGPITLEAVRRILSALPNLSHLALRNISVTPTALSTIPKPRDLKLSSFALYDTPSLTPKQLHWLLRSTTHAESLRTLALDCETSDARLFNPVRYVTLRVETLFISTKSNKVVESFVMACPSLKHLHFQNSSSSSSSAVNYWRLLANVESPLSSITDRSSTISSSTIKDLSTILESGNLQSTKELKLVQLNGPLEVITAEKVADIKKLSEVCLKNGVRLETLSSERDQEVPYIPSLFEPLRFGSTQKVITK